jgi:drug/metabolite transporter (DMT)-like permease
VIDDAGRAADAPGATPEAHATGTAFTLLAALGFAAVSTLTSVAVGHGTSLANVLTWRYVLASVVLVAYVGARGYPRMASREVAKFIVIGGGGQALLVGLALSSIAYIPVATLAFLFYTYPSWVTIVQAVRGAERVTMRRIVALGLSFGGIVVIAGLPLGARLGAAAVAAPAPVPDAGYWTGVGLALAAAVVYGAYIPTMQVLQKSHAVPVTSALAKIGSAACFLVWSASNRSFDMHLSASAWGTIAALALFSTVLPSVFFLMGLMRLGPVRTAIVSTVEPFITAIIGAIVLGQALTVRTLVGGAMIVSAVVILQYRRERVA